MQKGSLSTEWANGNNTVTLNVQVIMFEEDGIQYTYIPSFDLTGYGKTQKEAQQSLNIVLNEFLRYTINKKTFIPELKRLGWKIRSKSKPMTAPNLSELVTSNEQLKDIMDHKQFTSSNYQVNVPSYA